MERTFNRNVVKNSLGEIERLIEGTAIVKPGIPKVGL